MIRVSRRAIAALLIVLLTACHSWRRTSASPQQLISEEGPSSVRVTLSSGQVITFQNPLMINDSIVGMTESGLAGTASRDLRLLEVRRFSAGRTIGLVGLTAAAVAAVGFIALFIQCTWGLGVRLMAMDGARRRSTSCFIFCNVATLTGGRDIPRCSSCVYIMIRSRKG